MSATSRLLKARGYGGDHVQWLCELPESITGVVLASELLDALPVIRFEVGEGHSINELGVSLDPRGRLQWKAGKPFSAERMQDVGGRLQNVLDSPGYRNEVGFQAQAWVGEVARRMNQGAMILVDYGFPESEYYHPDRLDGTLMCHYRHTAHSDPFIHIGLQDITAHVDFSAIARAGKAAGMTLSGYAAQAQFLMSLGLLDRYQERIDSVDIGVDTLSLAAEIKKLTLPHEMGELFKVMALSNNINPVLRGFGMQNLAGRL